ncbi:MAG: hypothetical protein JWL88_26 [Parcubacteria group bacterium]|nr:hypothetical protein [Parcubacteria group bacterium]
MDASYGSGRYSQDRRDVFEGKRISVAERYEGLLARRKLRERCPNRFRRLCLREQLIRARLRIRFRLCEGESVILLDLRERKGMLFLS